MRLLLCDDHAIFRAGLRTILDGSVSEILEAGSADEALAVLGSDDRVDVVLLDLTMPGVDGWTALRKIRVEHPAIPVVIVSASEEPEEVRAALAGGAAGFIPKSSAASVFRSALQLVLEGNVYVPPVMLRPGAA